MKDALLSDDIIPRLRARDESAYREVVELYFTRLVRFSFRIVGSYDISEDIVQGVLIKISEQGDDFDPQGSLLAYLYTAVRNRSLNALRDKDREHLFQEQMAEEQISRDITDVEGTQGSSIGLDTDDMSDDISKIMGLLTERQRTAMRLRFMDGLTIPEISRVLGISITSTNRLIGRGLEILRENFRKAPEG